MQRATNLTENQLAKKFSARTIAGIDEVGRGALAGPLVTCCIIKNRSNPLPRVWDSKMLTHQERVALVEPILASCISWSIGIVSAKEISAKGMAWAIPNAFNRSLASAQIIPDIVLYDGRRLPLAHKKTFSIIDGDATCEIIAAASIIAKIVRDLFMIELDCAHPAYKFHQHKGYGTNEHRDALKKYGALLGIHRTSFRLL